MKLSFSQLGLRAEIMKSIAEKGYDTPTPIQEQAIPAILSGKDVLASAQTGTGKTAGFTLPVLELLTKNPVQSSSHRHVRALILVPTRELADQVEESVRTYGRYLRQRSAVVYGGVKIQPQMARLRSGVDVLIATPGRLLDHMRQKTVDLSRVEVLILDEADRMLDMGFLRDIRRIMDALPKKETGKRQNLMFSATFSDGIRKLASSMLCEPVCIDIAKRNIAASEVSQTVHPVDRGRKRELLSYLIGSRNLNQVLVFTRTKHGANRLVHQLERDGIQAMAIHGNKSQSARTKALLAFKNMKLRVLVATDVASRGIDIDQLPCVINFELPNVAEDYVHRIGRTGRAGKNGHAISLVCIDEHKLLLAIEKLTGKALESEVIDGFAPNPNVKPEPILKQSQHQQRRTSSKGPVRSRKRA